MVAVMSLPVAVLGYGVTGRSAVRYLIDQGRDVVLIDTRSKPEAPSANLAQVQCFWDTQTWPDISVEYAIVSPGLKLESCLVAGARAAGVTLRSDIDVFFSEISSTPVFGITGTNGKSTVTSLVGHLLSASGLNCGTGGNLGDAALNLIADDRDCYALELSSFQLERSRPQPFHVAAILNISEDHLDQHGDMSAYVSAKQRIYQQTQKLVFNRDDSTTRPLAKRADMMSYGSDLPPGPTDWGIGLVNDLAWIMHGERAVCAVADLPLPGGHNVANVMAAFALVDGFVSDDKLAAYIQQFSGLSHRFELVQDINEVSYVDDSKATNVGATLAALQGLPRREDVVLIAGGDAKGADVNPLAEALIGRVCFVVTLGVDGPAVGAVAQRAGIATEHVADMTSAVALARRHVPTPGLVLLSPACASLDMYANFMARGEAFQQAVHAEVGNGQRH